MEKRRIYNLCVTALISLTLVGTLALPLQAEVSAASNLPVISNKAKVNAKITPVKKRIKKKNVTMNLRLEAGQALYGFDTLQGSCYAKGYYYYILYNRVKNRSKIVRMKMKDKRVVKVSKTLKLYHSNDMTFNTRKNRLVVAHGEGDRRGLTVVNPYTLKIEKRHTIKLPENLNNLAGAKDYKNRLKSYSGFNNIAYNSKHKLYVVQLYTIRDFIYLNENFKPVRYVRLTERDSQLYQGMDSFGDYIIVCNSFSGGKPYNVLSVYDWDGNYKQKIVLNRGMELESLTHIGNKLYAGFYKAYVARYQWKASTSLQIKKYKVNGKTKRKLVKVKVYYKEKKRYYWTNRDNFLYSVKIT